MARRTTPHDHVEEQLKKEERGRRIVAKVRANKKFMAGVREGFKSQRAGKGVPLDDVKRDVVS